MLGGPLAAARQLTCLALMLEMSFPASSSFLTETISTAIFDLLPFSTTDLLLRLAYIQQKLVVANKTKTTPTEAPIIVVRFVFEEALVELVLAFNNEPAIKNRIDRGKLQILTVSLSGFPLIAQRSQGNSHFQPIFLSAHWHARHVHFVVRLAIT